jgi:hypothetical protein
MQNEQIQTDSVIEVWAAAPLIISIKLPEIHTVSISPNKGWFVISSIQEIPGIAEYLVASRSVRLNNETSLISVDNSLTDDFGESDLIRVDADEVTEVTEEASIVLEAVWETSLADSSLDFGEASGDDGREDLGVVTEIFLIDFVVSLIDFDAADSRSVDTKVVIEAVHEAGVIVEVVWVILLADAFPDFGESSDTTYENLGLKLKMSLITFADPSAKSRTEESMREMSWE